MQWRTNMTQQHGVELAKYYRDGDEAASGSWRYLTKLPRTRVRQREEEGETGDDDGGGGGNAQGTGRRRIELGS